MTDRPIPMSPQPDAELGRALERFDPPEFGEGFWQTFADGLADEPDVALPREWRRRPWLRLAAVAAAAAVVAVFILWFGLPGIDKVKVPGSEQGPVVVGPEPATAAQVLANIKQAYADGRFVQGTVIVSGGKERRSTFYAAADGSSRAENPGDAGGRGFTNIYNASLRTSWIYAPEWSDGDELAAETAYLFTGHAAGPPDRYDGFAGVYGGFARAAAAARDADVTSSVYDGRPVWVLTCSVRPGPTVETGPEESTTYRQVDRIAITVDEETCYPLRVQEYYKGDMSRETRIEDFRVPSSVPEGLFEFTFPEDAEVQAMDQGFREIELENVRNETGYAPAVPRWFPGEYTLRQVTVADESEVPVPGEQDIRPDYLAFASRDVVSARYGQGFLNITVTTRRLLDVKAAKQGDPFDGVTDFYMAYEKPPQEVELTSGAFKGSTASMYTVDLVLPHIWFIKGDLLVTVAGDATARELVRIANSLELLRD